MLAPLLDLTSKRTCQNWHWDPEKLPSLPFTPASLGIQILLEPPKRFIPPQPLVLRLSYPVAFIRENDQTTWNSLSLQHREHRYAFIVRNSEIQFARGDQHWCFEIRREQVR